MALLGKELIITDNFGLILASKSCEISTDIDLIETSSTSPNWKTFTTDLKEWSVSTNHIMSNVIHVGSTLLPIGAQVTLTIRAASAGVLPFDGIVTDGSIQYNQSIEAHAVEGIFFYQAAGVNFFVARCMNVYYVNWEGNAQYYYPQTGYLYAYNNALYFWQARGTALSSNVPYLQGTAIVKSAKVQAAVGSLAKGSFVFKGTGPLTGGSSS